MNFKSSCVLLCCVIMTGCIKNDVPYPNIQGAFTAFDIENSIKNSLIDNSNRTVTVYPAESVNPAEIVISEVQVSNNTIISPNITAGSTIDLSSQTNVTLSTYRDYTWTISAQQTITREISVSNQIGDAVFDTDNLSAVIYISDSQPLNNISIINMKLGPAGSAISPLPESVKDFTEPHIFTVTYWGNKSEQWSVEVKHSGEIATVSKINSWTKFAYISGGIAENTTSVSFEYREANATQWSSVPSSDITIDQRSFSLKLKGLSPDTEYRFRVNDGRQTGKIYTLKTEKAQQIPNLNFDNWYKDGTTWYADLNLDSENYWWDSGNKGANIFKENNPTSPEESFVVSGKAAKLQPVSVATVLASGSLFTGRYVKTSGMGAELSMGRAYTERPSKLSGYYSYLSGIINRSKAPYQDMEGQQDSFSIYIVLGDWDEAVKIDTNKKIFLDTENDPHIIAYGELSSNESNPGKYKEFEIELSYRDMERKPTYIIIVASSCKYGDYFTGSTNSLLYIDQFNLIF